MATPFRDACAVIAGRVGASSPATTFPTPFPWTAPSGLERPMKIRNSLKSLRGRHRDNQLVRRKGRVYVINKTQKRFKARQG